MTFSCKEKQTLEGSYQVVFSFTSSFPGLSMDWLQHGPLGFSS